VKSIQNVFMKVAELHYSPFEGTLRSGSMSDTIQLFPSPKDYHHVGDMDVVHCKISREMTICGFVDLIDVASAPAVSRHLVLPINSGGKVETGLAELKTDTEMEEDSVSSDEGKCPSFSVLLHGALKVIISSIQFNPFELINVFSCFSGRKYGCHLYCG